MFSRLCLFMIGTPYHKKLLDRYFSELPWTSHLVMSQPHLSARPQEHPTTQPHRRALVKILKF